MKRPIIKQSLHAEDDPHFDKVALSALTKPEITEDEIKDGVANERELWKEEEAARKAPRKWRARK